ncbi:MAG: neutral/alkaline non-lysosomal ceramidase N-terminal domain-containing protein [Bacteroidota bacterium]
MNYTMRSLKTGFLSKCILLTALSYFSINCAAVPVPKNSFTAGVSKVKITPEIPIPMSGYGGRTAPFKGIHDDLFARVIVFSDGVNKAVLISADVIGFSNSFWEETTASIAKETGIRKEFVLLAAVHNHGGPITKVYDEDSSARVNAYMEILKNKILIATKEAINSQVPVRIGSGKGECKMNINRRAPDGKGEIELGQNPYAPCDHEVGVISIDDRSGNPLAIIMNWPCHGVVLGPDNYLITGDWPGAASRYIEEGSNGKIIAPVVVGASGDINPIYGPHIDFEKNNSYAYGKDAIGEDLGKESLSVAKGIEAYTFGRITAVQRVIAVPSKEKETEKFLQPERKGDDSLRIRLSAIKIGSIVFTGVSGELFNQISVKMRSQSPYANTFMITHCNGSSGYLVSDDAFPKDGAIGSQDKYIPTGGYEVNSTSARKGAEKILINNLLEMINEL